MDNRTIEFDIDGTTYIQPSKSVLQAAAGLSILWDKLGRPPDVTSKTGIKLAENVMDVWKKYYRQEYLDWIHDREQDIQNERSIKEHSKNHGQFLLAYPPSFHALLKSVFPTMKEQDRKIVKIMGTHFPILKITNYSF